MRQKMGCCGVVLAIALTGCSTLDSFSSKSRKDAAAVKNSVAAQQAADAAEFSMAKKLKDPVKTRLAYASWLEQSENFQEARTAYLKVLEKSSKNTEAMLGLARIDRACGRENEADAQLAKALKYHPKDPSVLLAIGQVHAAHGEFPEAVEKIRMAHELAPYEKLFEYHLAVVEAQSGELDQALVHFSHSVGKAEGNYNIGYILNEKGLKEEAEEYFQQALKLKPDLKLAESALAGLRGGASDSVQPASFRRKMK
jgi:Flp pilus assembly protein TadD